MKTFIVIFVLALSAAFLAPQSAQANTRIANKEGMIGATTGGIAGGVIGHQQGRGIEGAIIGTVTGYALGTNVHRHKERRRSAEREMRDLRRQVREEQRAIREVEKPIQEQQYFEPSEPQRTRSEERQILLQAHPLYRVER